MPISDPTPGIGVHTVTATIDTYDELLALLLDHLLDHLHILLLVAGVGAIPDPHTHAVLAAHPRYHPFLDGSRQSDERLIYLLRLETHLLLAGLAHLSRATYAQRPPLYRQIRARIPYLGHSDYPPAEV
jgi:hypothetical protein